MDNQSTPAITLDHCVIHVSDWARSNAFYAWVLGATVIPRGNGFAHRIGGQQLNCHGPGVDATPVARLPVQPGNSDLCLSGMAPSKQPSLISKAPKSRSS